MPLTARGGGTSTAGNAVGAGIVLDFSRHLNRVLDVDPDARTALVEPGAILDDDHRGRRAARAALRPRPVHPRPRHASAARSATTPAARARCSTAAPPTTSSSSTSSPPTATRFTARRFGRDGLPRHGPAAPLLARPRPRSSRDNLAHDPHRVRPLPPAGVRLLARAPAARERRRPRQVPGRHRGHARPCCSARPCGWSSRRAAVALAVLGYPDMPAAADAVPGAAAARRRSRSRAWTRGWSTSCARRRGAGRGARPAARRRLAVRRDGRRHRGRGARRGREAGRRRRLPRLARSSPARSAARAVAHPRGRRRARRPHPGRRAGLARLGGRRRPARAPRRLPARVRRADARAPRWTGWSTATSATAACTSASTSRSPTAPARFREFVLDAAQLVGRHGGSMSGEHGDGRARGELLPYMYSPEAIAAFGEVKRALRPGQPAQPRRDRRPGAGRRRPARAGGAARCARSLALRLPARRRRPLDRRAPLRRGRQVPRRHHRRRRRDVPVLPRDPRREGLHPRPRAGAAGAGERLAGRRATAPTSCTRRSTCACRARAARRDCPAGVDMATYKAEVLHQRYRRRLRPPSHYALGWLPRWARLASRAPRAGQRDAARPTLAAAWPSGSAASTRAARCRSSRAQTFRAVVRRRGRGRTGHAGAAVGRHVHRPLHARGRRRPRCGCSRPPATRCRSPTSRCAAG